MSDIAVAFAWKECNHTHVETVTREDWPNSYYCNGSPDCHGTGKQYALPDMVRIKCWHTFAYNNGLKEECNLCKGRDSIHTTDAWIWLEATSKLTLFSPPMTDLGKTWETWRCSVGPIMREGKDPKEAFFEALSKDLVTQGYTLGE